MAVRSADRFCKDGYPDLLIVRQKRGLHRLMAGRGRQGTRMGSEGMVRQGYVGGELRAV